MKRAVFPGSFDPITIGHQDIVKLGLEIFDEIIIGIGKNEDKKCMFSPEKRLSIVQETFKNEKNVKAEIYEGLTVDFCNYKNSGFIIRGLRNSLDFEYEKRVALTNRKISGIETVFFFTKAENSFISSSLVREIIINNGDYSLLIPKGITI